MGTQLLGNQLKVLISVIELSLAVVSEVFLRLAIIETIVGISKMTPDKSLQRVGGDVGVSGSDSSCHR